MLEILIAFGLDLVLGDPEYSWHPVRIIGGWIQRTERWFRAWIPLERLAGLIQCILIPGVTYLFVWFLCEVAGQLQPVLGRVVSIYFIYSALAIKDLKDEARQVYAALLHYQLEKARKKLSRIVGRDTENLTEEEITRGTIEAVAESFVDGVLSPLLFAALGGAPLAMAYKAVNTLDSMVGRRTSEYRKYGFFPAKLDEIVNWIPARISWLLIGLGAAFVNGRVVESWQVGWKDGADTSFSNSVVPEAAFAGALGVQLGGTNFYAGEPVETPKLGYPLKSLEKDQIRTAYQLMLASSWVSLVFCVFVYWVVRWVFHRPL